VNQPMVTEEEAKKVAAWVMETKPSLEEIDQFLERNYPGETSFAHESPR
jgi:hypothetical protein